MAKRTTPPQPWTPFERERRRWVEELGYPTLLNVHRGHDPQLRYWAEETQRLVYIGRAARGGYKTSKWHYPYPLRAEHERAMVLAELFVVGGGCGPDATRGSTLRRAPGMADAAPSSGVY